MLMVYGKCFFQICSLCPELIFLSLTNSGLLESGFRPRRYQYQLLDPVDRPYAAFRFFCRPSGKCHILMIPYSLLIVLSEYLEDRGIVRLRDCASPCSSISSTVSQFSEHEQAYYPAQESLQEHIRIVAVSSPIPPEQQEATPPRLEVRNSSPAREDEIHNLIVTAESTSRIPLSASDDSLSVRTKDSIEELPSHVPRSPRSPQSPRSPKKAAMDRRFQDEPKVPPSPTRSPRTTRQRLKKKLTVNINGADFDVEKRQRPLSPFTSGGLLRKASVPHTAPPAVTEFGPTIDQEVKSKLSKSQVPVGESSGITKESYRTTSTERGGKKLMGFLGRRISGAKGL